MQDASELLRKLVKIPSISDDEKKVSDFVSELLNKEGFNVKKYPINNDRYNIVATLAPNPNIYLQAHLDTVPPFIELTEDEENFYGRGTCDTKGSTAAMITAGLGAKENGINNFGLIFTVGEETTLDGAEHLVNSGFNVPFVVVGEPSSLEIVNAHFGLLVIEIEVNGKAAHSSRPEEGINSLDLLIEYIQKIKSIEIHPDTLMSLVKINGGEADNIIPARAHATFSFRLAPGDKKNYFKEFSDLKTEKIKLKRINDFASVHTDVPKELDFIKVRRQVKYFTELSIFQKGVIIGPGDIKYAHGADEQLSKQELEKAIEIYMNIIENFNK